MITYLKCLNEQTSQGIVNPKYHSNFGEEGDNSESQYPFLL